MPTDPTTGIWHPALSPKQLAVLNEKRRYVLLSGCRWSTKTTASLHKILRHAWETPNARVFMATKYKGTALSGVWPKLTGPVMKEWLEAELSSELGGEFRYEVTPRELGSVRMQYFKLINYYGGVSEVQLHSISVDREIEEKMFSTQYTCIYLAELQHFSDPNVFYVTDDQLRMEDVPYEMYLWLSDTNPPPGDATQHFAYKIWYLQREAQPPEGASEDERSEFLHFQSQLALHEFNMQDAEGYVDPRQLAKIKAKYRHDPEAWARFVEGKWTKGSGFGDYHFKGVFRKRDHVFGSTDGADERDWELILPDPHATTLYAGWDIGKVNHALVIAQKILPDDREDGEPQWEILDELVVIADKVKIADFVREAIEKREKLEKAIGHAVEWHDWTDTSAFDWSKGGTDETDALIVEEVSRGQIQFQPATAAKRPGSIRKRVEKIRSLLSEQRLFISANCTNLIEMLENLRKGATDLTFVARGQKEKHIFDALSYVLYMETLEDLEEEIVTAPRVGRRLVSVG